MVIPTPLPQKSKELLQSVDSISPIAAASWPRSITPPVDTMELWENANKALEELLATKASIDTCRWRAIWELGMELHQNKS